MTTPMQPPAPVMDWEQVRLNGGPPCFALPGDTFNGRPKYCGRAERWPGHDGGSHAFVAAPCHHAHKDIAHPVAGYCCASVYCNTPMGRVPFDYCGNRLPCAEHPAPAPPDVPPEEKGRELAPCRAVLAMAPLLTFTCTRDHDDDLHEFSYESGEVNVRISWAPRRAPAPETVPAETEIHARVFEYDGAFRCLTCRAQWGALPGRPTEPPTCIPSCAACGGALAEIRGRYPREPRRKVCPTCVVEKLEDMVQQFNVQTAQESR
jgi:hypothetical protein